MNAFKIAIKLLGALIVVLGSASGCKPVASSGFPGGTYAIDHYKLKFEGNHYTQLTEFDQEIAQGSFSVDGKLINFSETDSPPECTAEQAHYSYEWAFDGKALTFRNPQDNCLSRSQLFTAQTWMKK